MNGCSQRVFYEFRDAIAFAPVITVPLQVETLLERFPY
jgi:hypothetical protein